MREMGDRLEEMPLFLLNTVLFPHAQIQIHVFEERYRTMVQDCLEGDLPFGIVLIRSGSEVGGPAEPYMVGTAVRIVSTHTFEDGKMDVRVLGERRFRIRRIDEAGPYMVGYVEPVFDVAIQDMEKVGELALLSKEYVHAYIENYFVRFNVKTNFPTDPTRLSFVVANFLQIENIQKQRLLETTDTIERLQEIVPILERHILEAKSSEPHRVTVQHTKDWIFPN